MMIEQHPLKLKQVDVELSVLVFDDRTAGDCCDGDI